MSRKKTVKPIDKPAIFTDEQPEASTVRIESETEFFDRVKQHLRAHPRDRGHLATATISFDSVEVLLNVLTPKRFALYRAVKQEGGFRSIESLASELHRDRAAVTRDLQALQSAGLLVLRRVDNPGHGARTEVLPVADTLKVQLVL